MSNAFFAIPIEVYKSAAKVRLSEGKAKYICPFPSISTFELSEAKFKGSANRRQSKENSSFSLLC
jgi:hypothetical protein